MRIVALAIVLMAPLLAQEQQPQLPKGPAQIGRGCVEDLWNKGDFRLVDQRFTTGVVLHYRGQSIPLTPESGLGIVRN